ncbi:cytochrome P450 monooxygenase-like protein, partial [Dinothrombium tinctorium]
IFVGLRPELIVGDTDLVKLILGKEFKKFPNRRFVSSDHYYVGSKGLFVLNFESWRRVRAITTPAFTSGKLRRMQPFIEECVDTLLLTFEKAANSGKSVDVKKMMSAFSMDVISSCAFGTKIDSQNNPTNPVVVNALKFFGTGFSIIRLIAFLFPKLITISLVAKISIMFRLSAFDYDAQIFLGNLMRHILKERELNEKSKRNDFIQLLADARLDANSISTESKDEADYGFLKEGYLKKLDTQEIIDQGITFFIAGFDTTSTCLSSTARWLAMNPDVQSKLCAEIDETFDFGSLEVDYNTLNEMKYLDAVVKESLRMSPPTSR